MTKLLPCIYYYKIHLFFYVSFQRSNTWFHVHSGECHTLYLHSCGKTRAHQVKALAPYWPSGILCEQNVDDSGHDSETLSVSATSAFTPNIVLPVWSRATGCSLTQSLHIHRLKYSLETLKSSGREHFCGDLLRGVGKTVKEGHAGCCASRL